MVGRNVKYTLWNILYQFFRKLNIGLQCNSANILALYSSEMETYVHIETYIRTFIAILFIIGQHLSRNNSNGYQWING
jgi:hypothetical protein